MAPAIQWTADRGNQTSQDAASYSRVSPAAFLRRPAAKMRRDAPVVRPLGAWCRHEGDGPLSDRRYRLSPAAAPAFVLRVVERADCLMATPSVVLDDVRRALLTRALR
jgi:hypothetical protein